ncbi:hypothetical protein VNI00_002375 [Paramarasmius palmivorus]|uniref:Uncharacterized protein n=1 Tax=Paramarasmius palmivorus TaxID=297713 RepID=A0AAW0DWQ9_9AGAR
MDSAMILTPPSLTLEGKPPSGQYFGLVAFFKLCDGEEPPPVYLFIHPPPTCMSELISWEDGTTRAYFWSFDETGQTCLSEEECEEWGIPELKLNYWGLRLSRWPAEAYQALHDWQVARDFDPTTADFARHLGYPELKILGTPKKTESRFEEIREEKTGKNSHVKGVQVEDQGASAEIPSKSAVRNVAIATSIMETTRSELADGETHRPSNSLCVGWTVAVAILCVIFVHSYIH